jgi:cystathionine beta-lyase/cystathionine gamma-synthase
MKRSNINSARVPVYRDSGFELTDAGTTASAFLSETSHEREPDIYIYSRYRNPTVVSAESEVMRIEGCKWALLTQTGMSAIDTVTSVFHRGSETGPWIFFSEIYGGTISYIESVLKARRGIDIHFFMPEGAIYDLDAFETLAAEINPSLVYVETISNPMLIVSDITGIIKIAGRYGAKVITDNTFATPYLYRPLEVGADAVIHSATKYFSGHGNITAGVVCGNDTELMKQAVEYRKLVGHMISPDDAYRLQTQLQTFELRFARQCSNAAKLADYLSGEKIIGKIWYPGLKNHPTHSVASRLFKDKGYGAMITFDFAGKDAEDKRKKRDGFIRKVTDRIKLIPTLGDPRTILMPVEAVWGAKYPEPGMIRLSVGFEPYEELREVVGSALSAL